MEQAAGAVQEEILLTFLPLEERKPARRKIRVTPANCPKLEIAFVNKFSNFGTEIEFVCSHLIKVCLFLWRERRRWEAVIKGS